MIVSAIVAVAENGVIGRDNDIPWRLSDDLKYFKRTTLNHHIITGRNNFLSIGRPLPKRTNVIITRNPFYAVDGCLIAHSVEEALQIAYENGDEEAFIIGGGKIYELSLEYWDRLYLTNVHAKIEGDVMFPELNMDKWNLISSEAHKADEKNEFDYTFNVYERKVVEG
jgi:dihydrofolate reductase